MIVQFTLEGIDVVFLINCTLSKDGIDKASIKGVNTILLGQ